MDSQAPRICPLCGAPVGLFFINFTEKLLMCEDSMCDFPFGYEELQIVTDESQLRDSVEWSGACSLPENDVSSGSSIVSTAAWADIDQLTRLYESDTTTDSKPSHQSQVVKKRREKKKYEEEMIQHLSDIKKLNDELNQLKRIERYNQIEKGHLLENLLRLQETSGRQVLKREELQNLQRKKQAELGRGELKININTVPNNIGIINIEICNDNENDKQVETNGHEAVDKANSKIQTNAEDLIPENKNQTDKTNQNDKSEETEKDAPEQVESNTIPNHGKIENSNGINSHNNINSTVDVINHVSNTLEELDIMEEGVTEENDIQDSGENLQAVGNVQVLALVDDMHEFPPITLEELSSNVVSEGPIMDEMEEAVLDEMQLISMNEALVIEGIQVIAVEPQTTPEDKKQATIQIIQAIENNIRITAENEMLEIAEKELQVTAEKPQVTVDKTQVTAEKLQGSAEKPQVTAEKPQITLEKPQLTADKEQATTVSVMQIPDKKVVGTKLQGPTVVKTQAKVSPPNEANLTPEEKSPKSEASAVPKRKRGKPKMVPKEIIETSKDEISKQNGQNDCFNNSNKLDLEPNTDQNSSVEIDQTETSLNEDQNETIEGNYELNTSADSAVKMPKKPGRKKGQKGVKRIVTEVRRSNRLSGKNT